MLSPFASLSPFSRPRFVASGGGTSTEFVTGRTQTTLRTNGDNYFTGFKFTMGGAGVTVTHVGRWNFSGDSHTHTVCLTDASGSVLGSVSIDTSLGTPGEFQYVALVSPVALSASTSYAVLSQESNAGDTFNDGNGAITHTAIATVDGAVFAGQTIGQSLNGGTDPNTSYGPVSFKYT